MDMSKEIRILMLKEDISITDMAKKLDTSQQNLSAKFKKNNFRISEIENLCELLGYELKIEFIKK